MNNGRTKLSPEELGARIKRLTLADKHKTPDAVIAREWNVSRGAVCLFRKKYSPKK